MKQSESVYEENGARRGFVGFFDLLGYKSLAENNAIAELISVVRKIQFAISKSQEKLNATEEFMGRVLPRLENVGPINHVVFSDSICIEADSGVAEVRFESGEVSEKGTSHNSPWKRSSIALLGGNDSAGQPSPVMSSSTIQFNRRKRRERRQ